MADTPRVTVPPQALEAIAFNLCSLHDFDVAFVRENERFATAVITEYVRTLSAAPAPEGGAVDGWRPIDSAPIGELVQVYWPCMALNDDGELTGEMLDREGHVSLSIRHSEKHGWEPDNAIEANGDWFGDDFEFGEPTHWKPRPSRPGAALASREEAPAGAGENVNWKAEYEAACAARISDRHKSQEAINERDKWIVELIKERDAPRAQPPVATSIFVARAKHFLDLAEKAEGDALDGDEGCVWPVEALRAAYADLTAQPAREDAQPVAWRVRVKGDSRWNFWDEDPAEDDVIGGGDAARFDIQALYTHPAPDALRAAAGALPSSAIYQKSETITVTALGEETMAELKSAVSAALPDPFTFRGGLDRIRAGDPVLGSDRAHTRDQQAHVAFVATHPVQALAALQAEQKGGA